MKKIFALFVLTFMVTLAANAQCGTTAVLTGCVGACGGNYAASYTVTYADVGPHGTALFCLAATSNSLCPNEIAFGALAKNSNRARTGVLSNGDVIEVKASVGDVLYVYVTLQAGNPNIQCIWQGETHFALSR